MKKKFLFLTFLFVILCSRVNGYDFVVNGIYYNIISGYNVMVTYGSTDYNSYSGNVVIPSTVTHSYITYNVISIGSSAFRESTGLTSVTIPNSITSIGSFAFSGCSGITQPLYTDTIFAYMPSSFTGAYNIPSGITAIVEGAFSDCTGPISVTIPNSVTSIRNYAFNSCTGLVNVTIPNSVASIGDYAFAYCTGLTNVTLPNSVTGYGTGIFQGCTGITQPIYNDNFFVCMPASYTGAYNIPNGITSIVPFAFVNCTGPISVTIPSGCYSIGNNAFCDCAGLTNVTIPSSVRTIGNRAFSGCTSLTNVVVPNGVQLINNRAFAECDNLRSITLPSSLHTIGSYTFLGCTNLNSVIFKKASPPVCSNVFNGLNPTYYIPCFSIGYYRNYSGFPSNSQFVESFVYTIVVNSADTASGTAFITQYPDCDDPTVVMTATGKNHHYFKRWSDGNTSNPRYLYNPTSDMTITAEFELYKYTINAYGGTNGRVTGGGTYDYGSTITLTATANDHYHFVNWSDGDTTNPRTEIVTETKSFTAIFEIDKHTISVNGVNGDVSGGGTYDYGAYVTLNTMPNEHYHFSSWTDGDMSNPRPITVTQDEEYTALFDIDKHTVDVACTNGRVSGTGTYDYGTEVTLTAIPDDHCYFEKWSDGDVSTTKTVVVTDDISLSAQFAKYQYTITATCEHGTVTGSGVYNYPDVVTLIVDADDGYNFVKWSDDKTFNPRVFVVEEDLTVEAICEKIPEEVGVDDVDDDAPLFYVVGETIYNSSGEMLRVYSASGKLLKQADTDIDMSSCPAGMYMVLDAKGHSVKMVMTK